MGELRRITEHYRLDKLVASSDSGSVFRATALATGAHVAVKLIGDIDERSTAQRDGFLKAAIELRSLRHPGVPQTLDFGFTTGGSAFLVTEYVNGASLGLLVGAEPKQVVGIALHLVAALEALGAIPYHNLRLDNVLVVPGGDEDGIKLLGLCSALSLFGPSDESPSPVLPPDSPGGSAGRPGDVAAPDLRRFATIVCQLLGVSPDAADAGIAPAGLELPASATSLPRPEALRSWLASCLRPAPEAHLLTWVAARGALQWSLGVGSAREEACDAEAGRQPIQTASGSRLENTLMILPVPPTEGEAALPARGVGGGERLEKTVQIRPEALLPEGPEAAGPALLAGQPAPAGGAAGAFEKTVQLRALPEDHTLAHPASRREASEPPGQAAPGDRPLSPETLPSFWPPEPAQPSGETQAPVALGLVESGPHELADPADPPDQADSPDPTAASHPVYLLQPDLPAVAAEEPAPLPVRPHRLRVVPREGLEAETAVGAPEVPAPDQPHTVHAAASATGAAAASPRQPPSAPPADLRGPRVRGGGWRPAVVAAALLVLAGGGALVMLWPRQPRRTPISTPVALSASRLQPPAAAPGAPHPPAGSPAPTALPSPPGPALAPGIAQAGAALAGGDLAAARQALAAISSELVASLQPAERERYEAAAAAVELASREQVGRELAAGFDSGNLARLNSALVISRGLHAPPSQLRQGLDHARRAAAAAARLARAERGHNQAEVLAAASDLQKELPAASQAGAAREQAAAALEGQAQAALDAGHGERALAALEDIRRSWPDRSGLNESFARVTAQRQADSRLESALAAAARAEQAGQPLQGLEALAGARPNSRFADRFRAQRERLEDLLARLDSSPPTVALAEAFKSEYEKGAVSVPLRITDDFQVKTVECWARAQGGTYAPVPVRHGTGPDYLVEIPESLHQNKMIEFYVIASDPSGHQGLLGSRSEPVRIKRKGWLSRIFGAKPTEQR